MTEPPRRSRAAQEWAEGWRVVLAGVIGYAAASIHLMSVGVLMKPLVAAFGWSRAQISASVSIASLCGIVTAPLMGRLVDRYGARAVGSVGLPLYCLGVAAAGLTGPSIWSWYLVWSFVALVYFAAATPVWTQGVASRFDAQRGLALAICFCGVALASSLVPPSTAYLLERYGWRTAYFVIGGVALVVGWTTLRLFFYDAKALTRRTTAATPVAAAEAQRVLVGLAPREAFRSTLFWRLATLPAIAGLAQGVVVVHVQAIMTDAGVSLGRAASYAAIVGPAMVVGRLFSGVLLDRLHGRYVAALDVAMLAGGVLLLAAFTGKAAEAVGLEVLLGLGIGAEFDTLSYMASRYFGLKHFGAVFGVLIGVNGFAYGLGPLLAGVLYDALGTYGPMLVTIAATLAAGALLMLTMPAYPRWAGAEEAAAEGGAAWKARTNSAS